MSKQQAITFDGIPVSVNQMYRNARGRGRVKTQRYNTWLNSVNWQIAKQAPEKIEGEIEVSIFCKKPVNKDGSVSKVKRDIDNCIKAVLDMLVSNNLIEDDSKIVKISAEWTRNSNIAGTLVMYEARV